MNVIVVGAGIAGLSTAWSLIKAGHSVSILEQGPIPNPWLPRETIIGSSVVPIARGAVMAN